MAKRGRNNTLKGSIKWKLMQIFKISWNSVCIDQNFTESAKRPHGSQKSPKPTETQCEPIENLKPLLIQERFRQNPIRSRSGLGWFGHGLDLPDSAGLNVLCQDKVILFINRTKHVTKQADKSELSSGRGYPYFGYGLAIHVTKQKASFSTSMNNTATDKTQKWLATTAMTLEHDIDDQKRPPMLELTKTTVSDQKMPLIPLKTTEPPQGPPMTMKHHLNNHNSNNHIHNQH